MNDQHKEIKLRIASNIRKYRKSAGLTQQELANRLNAIHGTSLRNNTISSWENGVNSIDNDFIPAIAQILRISIMQLYGQSPTDYDRPYDSLYHSIEALSLREKSLVEEYIGYLLWKREEDPEDSSSSK